MRTKANVVGELLTKPSVVYPLGIDWVWFSTSSRVFKSIINWLLIVVTTLFVLQLIELAILMAFLAAITYTITAMVSSVNEGTIYATKKHIKKHLNNYAQSVVEYNIEPTLYDVLVSRYPVLDDKFSPEQFENLTDKEMNWIKKQWNISLKKAIKEKSLSPNELHSNKNDINDFGKNSFGKELQYHLQAIEDLRKNDASMKSLESMSELEEFDRELNES